ncbi:MAG: hypothetical protein KAG66_11340, partial [Methylococcales bacterium]|nr:hypothetical protein [Methylococcales bacterium]
LMIGLFALLLGGLVACGGKDEPEAKPETSESAGSSVVAVDEGGDQAALGSDGESDSAEITTTAETTTKADKNGDDDAKNDDGETVISTLDLSTMGFRVAGVDTYQFDMTMNTRGTKNVSDPGQTIHMTMVFDKPNEAERIMMLVDGVVSNGTDTDMDSAVMENVEFVIIGDTTYIDSGEAGCFTMSSQDSSAGYDFDELFGGDEMMQQLADAERVMPNEMINGLETMHFTFDQDSFDDSDDMIKSKGDIYVAVDGKYLVRMVMEGLAEGGQTFGTAESGDQRFELQYDITKINEKVKIVPPTGCDEPTTSDYPLPNDAFETATFGAMTTTKTAMNMADTVAFYTKALVKEGWESNTDATMSDDTFAMLAFTRNDESLNVIITPDSLDENVTSVVLTTDN